MGAMGMRHGFTGKRARGVPIYSSQTAHESIWGTLEIGARWCRKEKGKR
jgi:hypothetical protein